MTIQIELESLRKETDIASKERRDQLEKTLTLKQDEAGLLTEKWEKERAGDQHPSRRRRKIWSKRASTSKLHSERATLRERPSCGMRRSRSCRRRYHRRQAARLPEPSGASTSETLIHDSVTADDIASVVAKATGIPVTKLMAGEIEKLVHMEDTLRQSVRGQDEALTAVANAVRMQRAGLSGENRPLASFMFLGPTGVGKTELCKKMASPSFSPQRVGAAALRHERVPGEAHHQHASSGVSSRICWATKTLVNSPRPCGGSRTPYSSSTNLRRRIETSARCLLQVLDAGVPDRCPGPSR